MWRNQYNLVSRWVRGENHLTLIWEKRKCFKHFPTTAATVYRLSSYMRFYTVDWWIRISDRNQWLSHSKQMISIFSLSINTWYELLRHTIVDVAVTLIKSLSCSFGWLRGNNVCSLLVAALSNENEKLFENSFKNKTNDRSATCTLFLHAFSHSPLLLYFVYFCAIQVLPSLQSCRDF